MEITIDPKFNQPELNQIEMHSFHNVMTVIFGELQFLETVLDDKTALAGSLALCEEFTRVMKDKDRAREFVRGWDEHKQSIMDEIKAAVAAHPGQPRTFELNPKIHHEYQENFQSRRRPGHGTIDRGAGSHGVVDHARDHCGSSINPAS